MPNVLNEILQDKKNFPDETVFTLGNGKQTTIGELRSLHAEREQKLSTRDQELTRLRSELDSQAADVANMFARVQERERAIQEAAATRSVAPGSAPAGAPDQNDYYAPLRTYQGSVEFSPLVDWLQKDREALVRSLQMMGRSQQALATMLAEERWDRQYDYASSSLKEAYGDDPVPSRADLIKMANDARDLDNFGTPNIRRTADRLRESRLSAKREAELRRASEEKKELDGKVKELEGRQQNRIVSIPRPGGGGSPVQKPKVDMSKINRHDPFGQAIDAARNDPSMWSVQ